MSSMLVRQGRLCCSYKFFESKGLTQLNYIFCSHWFQYGCGSPPLMTNSLTKDFIAEEEWETLHWALKRHMFFLLSVLARTSHMALTYLQGRKGNAKAMESLRALSLPHHPCFVRIRWNNVYEGFTVVPEEAGQTTQADSGLKLGLNDEWADYFHFYL